MLKGKIVLKIGDKITNKEKEEITALFEETDRLWINLQGKDRQKRI